MQHKFFKKLALLCMAAMVLSTVLIPNNLVYGAPNDVSLYEDVTEISDRSTVLTRGNYLNYGAITLTKVSATRVRITGETAAHRVCDGLEVRLELYRSKDGKNYELHRDWTYEKDNASYLWKDLEVIVPSGYYYALRGVHTAVYKGNGEMTATYAEGLWVN